MPLPKRHHYIPQFYLNGFCQNNKLWVYDRYQNDFRRQTPKNTTLQKHYYSFESKEEKRDTEIEKVLSQIEGFSKPIITKINKREKIDQAEKETLSLFIALQFVRVPDFEKAVNQIAERLIRHTSRFIFADEKRAEEALEQYEEKTGKKAEVSPKELAEFVLNDEYNLKCNRDLSLGMMLPLGLRFANYFRQMDWLILYAPRKTSFITSDNPFVLVGPPNHDLSSSYGVGFITKGANKVVPLSQFCSLIMGDHGDQTRMSDCTPQDVRSMNISIALSCDRFLLSRDEALLRSLVKTTRINEKVKHSRFKLG
ncbi:MAG: DUF4238 domain-containing protein [Pseudomonadota bacterium]